MLRPGCEKRYHFSPFTCSLNEMEEGVAPTDSRFRTDQRIMEEGDFDKANSEKVITHVKFAQTYILANVCAHSHVCTCPLAHFTYLYT